MTLDRAIRLARVWAFGGVCSLKEGEAQEYHKLALEALEYMRDVKRSGKDERDG